MNSVNYLKTCEQTTLPVLKEHNPSKQEVLNDYEINIRFLSLGCVISVGCKSIPFSTKEDGIKALNEYFENPYETRKIWEEKINKQ